MPITDTTDTTTTVLDPSSPESLQHAQDQAALIRDEDVIPIRVDVGEAALSAMGCMPAIEQTRDALVDIFGDQATAAIADLVPAARAVRKAHAAYTATAERDLEPMAKELSAKRARLLSIASAMVRRGLIDDKALKNLEGGQSYMGLSNDLAALAAWFLMHAERFGEHCKLTTDELAAAEDEAEAFGRVVKERDKARAGSTPAAKSRARAFTYFFRSYQLVRKLVTYTRWHEGDYEQIAPSLYAGRTRKSRDAAEPEPTQPELTQPNAPVAPGMPGGDPFAPNT